MHKAWHVINSTVGGARAGHHLIPKAALGKIDDIWTLFRRRSAGNVGVNIINMSAKYHDELHKAMNAWKPSIAPVEKMKAMLDAFPGGRAGYLAELSRFYMHLDKTQPHKFKGIWEAFDKARDFIGPANLM